MVIGINRNTKPPVTTIKKNQSSNNISQAQSGNGARKSHSSFRNDSVSLTSSATQLQELENHIATSPVVDAEIVDAVQQKISTGDYEVDDKSTANKLLSSEKKLASP